MPCCVGRRSIAVFVCCVAVLCGPVVARAQSPVDGFDPGANDLVSAFAVQADGKILAGGSFTMIGGGGSGSTPRYHIARLNVDGSVDVGFDPGAIGPVYAFAVQPDGKIVVVGNFLTLGGSPRQHIGRLNADASLDTLFNPSSGGPINAVAVQADGKILVGGVFTTLDDGGGPVTRNNIGRFNADGSLDTFFNPGSGPGPGGEVFALKVQPDGKILVAGAFLGLGGTTGTTPRNHIGRLNADGTVDAFNPNANSDVKALALQLDGKIVLAGHFNTLGGAFVPRNFVGRVNADGSLDASFNPGADDFVETLALQPDGKIVVGGLFTALGGGTGTTPRAKLGRINGDGSVDAAFDPGATEDVYAVAVQSDGHVLVGGIFLGLGGGTGATPRFFIGRLNADGSLETDFDPGADDIASALALQRDGKILIGGDFLGLGGGVGSDPHERIGRINQDGSIDTTFNPSANCEVEAIALQPDDKILVGGFFTDGFCGPSTITRNSIARLAADGTLDTSFDPGADDGIVALAVQPDGKVIVGGFFSQLGGGGDGTTTRYGIGRLNADGTLDTSFDVGSDAPILTGALQPDGKIVIGGFFTNLGDGGLGSTPRNFIGRVNPDGTLDTSFDPGADGPVFAVAVQPDGNILVGGDFSGLGDGTGATPRSFIGRVSGVDGSVDSSFDPGADAPPFAFALQTDGKILVGGYFSTMGDGGSGSTDRFNIARLYADGTVDLSFDPGADNGVVGIAVQPDGKILVIGDFTGLGDGIGATGRSFVGRLTNTDAAIQALDVTGHGSVVTWLRSGAGPEVDRVTFESSSDGTTYTMLGSGTRAAGGWELTGQSLAVSQNLFVRARGYYQTGFENGSGSIVESILNTYVPVPVATDDAIAVTEDVVYGGTLSASDADGDPLTFSIVSDGVKGAAVVTNAATGAFTYTPNLNVNGADSFTFKVNDGTMDSNVATITVAIAAVNDVPTLNAIPDPPAILEDAGLQTVNLSGIGAGGGETQTLTVTALSNNTALIPNPTVSYTSPNATGSLSYTPVADASGSAIVTVTVTETSGGSLSVARTFTVNVTAVNDAPTISNITDRQVPASTSVAIPFTVGDIDTAPSSLSITAMSSNQAVVSNPGLVVSSGGTSRTLTLTPVANQVGTATITVTVDDGAGGTAFDTFVVTVVPSLSIGDATVLEGNSGQRTMTFTITLAGPSASLVSVHYATEQRTAIGGVDYVGTSGTASFAPSVTGPSTFTVTVNGDTATEIDETFVVSLSSPVGAVLVDALGVGTIVNDDPTTVQTAEFVTWGRRSGVLVDGNILVKTALAGWTAGASSSKVWTTGDGSVEFSAPVANQLYVVGVSRSVTRFLAVTDIEFGVQLNADGTFAVVEHGVNRTGSLGPYGSEDRFAIAVSGGVLAYQRNGVTFYTSGGTPVAPLRVDAALFTPVATIADVVLAGRLAYIGGEPAGDFDGDWKADVTVFRPSTGGWYDLHSSGNYTSSSAHIWGTSGDVPVSGDYDGDGQIDPAVFRPSTGGWYFLMSSTNYTTSGAVVWGISTDVPVPGDYDGDRKTDPAVFRPSTGGWYFLKSSTNFTSSAGVIWGASADTPVPGDYDGDGKADPAVFRPSTGGWYFLKSSTNFMSSGAAVWGAATDVAVPGDYDGDGKIDPAVFRPSTGGWYFLKSSTNFTSSDGVIWGIGPDVPVPGDYDGDGKTDPAIFRPSTGLWAMLQSSTGYTSSVAVVWGVGTDTPINKRP